MNTHEGHRKRLKELFLTNGLGGLADHVIVELLLFYALPRGDVNPLAHKLVDTFGSLSGVFDAKVEELMQIPGVGKNAAILIKLIPQVARSYLISRTEAVKVLSTVEEIGRYAVPLFYGENDEVAYLICMDAKRKILGCKQIARGGLNSVNVTPRKIVETALGLNASHVVMAHDHPSGIAVPSREDEETTLRIAFTLKMIDITMVDHVGVSNDDFVSMASNGLFKKLEDNTGGHRQC